MKQNKKICTGCMKNLDFARFSKHKLGYFGLRPKCKTCISKESLSYHRTKKGLITKIFSNMNRKGFKQLNFSKKELTFWLESQPKFHKLYDIYVKNDYDSKKKPSIDRIDDYKGYTFDNIQLMTWEENYKKSRIDMANGNNTKTCKAVIKMDLEGNTLKEYFSMAEAGRKEGVNWQSISACCRGLEQTCGGFKWKYK